MPVVADWALTAPRTSSSVIVPSTAIVAEGPPARPSEKPPEKGLPPFATVANGWTLLAMLSPESLRAAASFWTTMLNLPGATLLLALTLSRLAGEVHAQQARGRGR